MKHRISPLDVPLDALALVLDHMCFGHFDDEHDPLLLAVQRLEQWMYDVYGDDNPLEELRAERDACFGLRRGIATRQ